MPRFKFQFQPLLDHREQLRLRCCQQYRLALQTVQQAELEIRSLQAEYDGQIDIQQASCGERIDSARMLQIQRYRYHLQQQIQQRRLRLHQLESQAEQQRAQMIDADRQVQVLRKLRGEQFQLWQRSAEKQVQQQIDEYAARSASLAERDVSNLVMLFPNQWSFH